MIHIIRLERRLFRRPPRNTSDDQPVLASIVVDVKHDLGELAASESLSFGDLFTP
jgi:hypothetical protein